MGSEKKTPLVSHYPVWMQSVMKIVLVALFAQVYAQTEMDKLNQWPLANADLDAATLAGFLATAVNPPVAMVPPAIAQIRPDLRVRPNVAFVIAEEAKEEAKEAPPPKAAANVRFFKKNPAVPLEKTPNSFVDMQKSNPDMKKLLADNKANCYFKGCGGKGDQQIERSYQVVSIPAVAVCGLLLGSAITFAMRRSRVVKAEEPLQV